MINIQYLITVTTHFRVDCWGKNEYRQFLDIVFMYCIILRMCIWRSVWKSLRRVTISFLGFFRDNKRSSVFQACSYVSVKQYFIILCKVRLAPERFHSYIMTSPTKGASCFCFFDDEQQGKTPCCFCGPTALYKIFFFSKEVSCLLCEHF